MNLVKLYSKFARWPGGKFLFSKLASLKAPYFSSIKPYISDLTAIQCVVELKKRHRVLNHLGTVHAIAMCNACEFAFGLTMEAGLPKNLRWIPKGMTVRYLKKAETDLTTTCHYPDVLSLIPGDHVVPIKVTDTNKQIVMEAEITVYVSQRKN